MAQKVSILLVDDIDESEASETVTFALDGNNYEIDLNDKHAKDLRASLTKYVDHARKVAGKRASGRKAPVTAGKNGASPKEMRTWALQQGMEVPDRGRIPESLRVAYDAAH